MPILKTFNKDFFKTWTQNMSYVLGFFAADGYIGCNKRGGHFFAIQIKDYDLLNEIRTVLKSNHKISYKKVISKKHSQLYRLQIGSKELFNDLLKLGFTNQKTKRMTFPSVPQQFMGDFIRGYFDGDGNVWSGLIHKNRKTVHRSLLVCFTSCSKEFLFELQSLLSMYSVGKGCFRNLPNYSRLSYSLTDALKIYNLMYNNAHSKLFLERKKKVFEPFIQMRA